MSELMGDDDLYDMTREFLREASGTNTDKGVVFHLQNLIENTTDHRISSLAMKLVKLLHEQNNRKDR